MKILVLGANGQLGSDLFRLRQQAALGAELIPFLRNDLDLMDSDRILPVLMECDFDILVNATGYNRVNDAETETKKAMALNASAVGKMARACEAKKARFVHISTDFVFDGEKGSPYREADAVCPINFYGASKALGESLARQFCSQALILRTASLFGINTSRSKGNFVETILAAAKAGKTLSVIRNVVMSPTGTADLARIVFTLIEKNAAPGLYHAVNSGFASWYDFAKEILGLTGLQIKMVSVANKDFVQKAKRPAYTVLDNAKTASILGGVTPS